MSTPIITYDKRPVIVSPTAPTSLEQLRYLWLDISETTPVLRYYNNTGIWEAINNVDTSSFLTTNGVQTITGAKTFNTGTITVADITVGDVTIEGIDTIKLTDDDTHVPTSKLVEDTLVSAISGLETSIEGELATKANDNEVVKLTGDQIVQGVKEFRNNTYFNGSILFGTSGGTMSSFNNVDQYLDSPSTTTVPSTQAVADALSEKQNALKYYSEASGDAPSATISVANIKLTGGVAEGSGTASGTYSHAEGVTTTASGGGSHAEGRDTTASGTYSHAEGSGTEALQNSSHAEGNQTTASGQYSHAEGSVTTASGQNSHTEGLRTTASGQNSHAEGYRTTASSENQHAQGKWNIEDVNNKYADIIGNGSSSSARSNAATVSWDGISWSQTDVRSGGTDQDAATHSLSAKQNATDNNLTTTDKTIVGAINELSTDKQNTLKYYSESDSSTEPSSNNAQVSILGSSDYQTTLNLGFESSNGIQTVNIGGSSNDRRINIGTKICGNSNNVTIGNASDGVLLTLNTGRGLAGTGVTKDLSTSATDAQFPTAAAVNNQLILKQNITDNTLTTTDKTIVGAINEIENKVLDSHLSKLSAGTLYFNNAKLFGSNFTIPNFPFSICATVRVDSWEGSTDGMQTIFQFGNNGAGALLGAMCLNNVKNNPGIVLRISKNTDGTLSYSEVSYTLNTDTFLGKEHTIIGVCRELESTPVNFDIYVDGAKVATSYYKGLTLDSLSGTVNYAVNTSNQNYAVQPAAAYPMMLRNLYVFNFDVSAEGAPYSIADYVAGRLIPPALKPSQVSLALENYTIARNATTKLVKDASGNSNDATVQGSGTVAGDNDQSIKVFVDEIKTQTSLTSLQFNVYGTDKKIIPGKYMRLIFSQDSNGNVTPTYISEEEWNDVYDV